MSKAAIRFFTWFMAVVLFVSLACNLPGHLAPPDELSPKDLQQASSPSSSPQNPSKTTQPAAKSLAEAGSSRSNPASGTELVHLDGWDLQVKQVLRGDPALQLLRSQDGKNLQKIPGWDFVAAQVHIRNTLVGHQMIDLYGLTITGDNQVTYLDNFWGLPAPEIVYSDFFTAEAMDGWVDALVPQSEKHLILALEPDNSFQHPKNPFYMTLEPGASVDTTPPPAVQPTALGKDPTSPAPFGATVTNGDWEATLLESARGDKAKALMETYHGSYMDPPAGMDVLIVRSRIRYFDAAHRGSKESIDTQNTFKVYPEVSAPDVSSGIHEAPPLPQNYVYFYPGGVYEGWSTLLIPAGTNPVIVQFEKGDPRYMLATQ
jgi:hypothetical protein